MTLVAATLLLCTSAAQLWEAKALVAKTGCTLRVVVASAVGQGAMGAGMAGDALSRRTGHAGLDLLFLALLAAGAFATITAGLRMANSMRRREPR